MESCALLKIGKILKISGRPFLNSKLISKDNKFIYHTTAKYLRKIPKCIYTYLGKKRKLCNKIAKFLTKHMSKHYENLKDIS